MTRQEYIEQSTPGTTWEFIMIDGRWIEEDIEYIAIRNEKEELLEMVEMPVTYNGSELDQYLINKYNL